MKRRNVQHSSLLLGAATVALGLSVTGCYTILRHPTVAYEAPSGTDAYDYEPIAVQWRSDCVGCHTNYDLYHNPNSPYGYYSRHGYDRWSWYYDLPWWADRSGYYPAADENGELPDPRQFGRRGSSGRPTPQLAPPAAADPPPTGGGVLSKQRSDEKPKASDENKDTRRQEKGKKDDAKRRRQKKDPDGGEN